MPTVKSCPECGNTPQALRHDWLYRCPGCGLLSSTLEPAIPTTSKPSRIDEQSRGRGLDPIRKRNNAIILDQIASKFAFGGTVLDVGCGQGQFLSDAMQRGFRVTGIEPDANVAPRTQEKTGAEIRSGFFPDVLQMDEKYDVIIFNDVLEHIPNVEQALTSCVHHLSDSGILIVNCPNSGGTFYRIANALDRIGITGPFERLWQFNLPSPHVWYFSSEHLQRLGNKVGLRMINSQTLLPIGRSGLADRIFHIEGQSKIMGVAAYLGTLAILPLLSILPRDICVVFFSRAR